MALTATLLRDGFMNSLLSPFEVQVMSLTGIVVVLIIGAIGLLSLAVSG